MEDEVILSGGQISLTWSSSGGVRVDFGLIEGFVFADDDKEDGCGHLQFLHAITVRAIVSLNRLETSSHFDTRRSFTKML